MRRLLFVSLLALLVGFEARAQCDCNDTDADGYPESDANSPCTATSHTLQNPDSGEPDVTVTWTGMQECGLYANGGLWIDAPPGGLTITSLTPAFADNGCSDNLGSYDCHGHDINPTLNVQNLDGRVGNGVSSVNPPSLANLDPSTGPISILKAVSTDGGTATSANHRCTFSNPCFSWHAVITIVDSPPASPTWQALRPGYAGASNLKLEFSIGDMTVPSTIGSLDASAISSSALSTATIDQVRRRFDHVQTDHMINQGGAFYQKLKAQQNSSPNVGQCRQGAAIYGNRLLCTTGTSILRLLLDDCVWDGPGNGINACEQAIINMVVAGIDFDSTIRGNPGNEDWHINPYGPNGGHRIRGQKTIVAFADHILGGTALEVGSEATARWMADASYYTSGSTTAPGGALLGFACNEQDYLDGLKSGPNGCGGSGSGSVRDVWCADFYAQAVDGGLCVHDQYPTRVSNSLSYSALAIQLLGMETTYNQDAILNFFNRWHNNDLSDPDAGFFGDPDPQKPPGTRPFNAENYDGTCGDPNIPGQMWCNGNVAYTSGFGEEMWTTYPPGSAGGGNANPTIDCTDTLTLDEDCGDCGGPTIAFSCSITDADTGDTLTCSIGTPSASRGSVVLTDSGGGTGGSETCAGTYQPDADDNGSDAFTIRVSDGTVSIGDSVAVTINAVNDPPTATAVGDAPAFLSGCTIRHRMEIDGSALTSAISDFPHLLLLNGSRVDYTNIEDTGLSLRVTAEDAQTILDYEVVGYDETGTSQVFFRKPTTSPAPAANTIYLYEDCAASDNSNPAGVWSDSYHLVYHMEDATTSVGASDLTLFGSTSFPAGQLGDGLSFAGDLDDTTRAEFFMADEGSGIPLLSLSWFWQTQTFPDANPRIFEFCPNVTSLCATQSETYVTHGGVSNTIEIRASAVTGVSESNRTASTFAVDNWFYFQVDGDLPGTAIPTPTLQVDGGASTMNEEQSGTGAEPLQLTAYIGNRVEESTGLPDREWDGIMDELRISSVLRSAEYRDLEHLSVTDQLVDYSVADVGFNVAEGGTFTRPAGTLHDQCADVDDTALTTAKDGTEPCGALTIGTDGSIAWNTAAGTPCTTGAKVAQFTCSDDEPEASSPANLTLNVTGGSGSGGGFGGAGFGGASPFYHESQPEVVAW